MKLEKYLVTIEFRYVSITGMENEHIPKSKVVTIGVFDTFEIACENGNSVLEILESKFELHQFPDGSKAAKERFSKNGGCFGGKKDLVSNLAYLKTPFKFYAKIETLKYEPINEVIDNVISSVKNTGTTN